MAKKPSLRPEIIEKYWQLYVFYSTQPLPMATALKLLNLTAVIQTVNQYTWPNKRDVVLAHAVLIPHNSLHYQSHHPPWLNAARGSLVP